MALKLHNYVLSGNCYKIRLLIHFLRLKAELVPVDFFPGLEHKTPAFLDLNPLGQLPVLEDGDLVLRDAQAILLYLANRYDDTQLWWPANDPVKLGQVAMWLAFADQITATASAARLHDVLGYDLDVVAARKGANAAFRVLEDHLTEQGFSGRGWLVGDTATIADIACFPYTALAGDGGIVLDPYPAIRRWIRRFMAIDGFENMPGINNIR